MGKMRLQDASQVAEIISGEMTEWPKVPDSKSGVPKGTVGSTPTLSSEKRIFAAPSER